jgi:hypothetical protein
VASLSWGCYQRKSYTVYKPPWDRSMRLAFLNWTISSSRSMWGSLKLSKWCNRQCNEISYSTYAFVILSCT